jgi:hypothetical protein
MFRGARPRHPMAPRSHDLSRTSGRDGLRNQTWGVTPISASRRVAPEAVDYRVRLGGGFFLDRAQQRTPRTQAVSPGCVKPTSCGTRPRRPWPLRPVDVALWTIPGSATSWEAKPQAPLISGLGRRRDAAVRPRTGRAKLDPGPRQPDRPRTASDRTTEPSERTGWQRTPCPD